MNNKISKKSSFQFKRNHSTNYASELPKLQKLLMQAYADYDGDKVWKLRETRKQYRVKIAERVEELGIDIGEYATEDWYEESLDKLTYQAQYLESMYNSGAPMNANQVEALILTRGL